MAIRAADPSAETLTPKLTEWDRRVLSKLPAWNLDARDQSEWKDAWTVARELRSYDVADVRRTLDGLANFHYAWAKGFDHRRVWCAAPAYKSHEGGEDAAS